MRVHIINLFCDRGIGFHRQNRAEQLLLHRLHIIGDILEDGQRHLAGVGSRKLLVTRIDLDHLGALVTSIGDDALQPVEMPVSHDAGVIVVLKQCGVHIGDTLPHAMDGFILLVFGHIEIIRREADLPSVHHLAQSNPFTGLGEIGAAAHEHRRFTAQFQRHGNEISRSGLHHLAPGRGRSGEDQMIERQAGKCVGDFWTAGEHGHFLSREILADQFGRQFTGSLGEFAGLDHRAIARGQNLHQRAEAEINREIPG